ncbi:hypothetical protein SD37_13070 [Amycolatopsis orientalis]|uniref:Mce-associated membrane protein n=1 Tax=Amycolatopsis orientalis TaxID=31958 RepID=A0A193BW83_AMYOR|nr:hypothetical protein [Amycolatopsis orientalis]ANN16491.1 hypothetical protein SD37_13070 [Amycolatopsis orientalis]
MLTRALTVVATLAVLAAAWTGWSWWSAARDDGLARGREREAVLTAASGQLEVLNTIDYRTGAQDVDRWLGVTTGRLGKELAGDRQLQIDRANTGKTVATAKLEQAAVTELDAAAGTARLMAVLNVRISTGGGSAVPKISRLTVDYQRAEDGWKVSAVQAAGS